jgi:hypothetical protein
MVRGLGRQVKRGDVLNPRKLRKNQKEVQPEGSQRVLGSLCGKLPVQPLRLNLLKRQMGGLDVFAVFHLNQHQNMPLTEKEVGLSQGPEGASGREVPMQEKIRQRQAFRQPALEARGQ